MYGEIKDFKDVQRELERMKNDIENPHHMGITKDVLLNVQEIKKSVSNKYGTEEANIINIFIQNFNQLIKNIKGH
jgi:hypothetical protein